MSRIHRSALFAAACLLAACGPTKMPTMPMESPTPVAAADVQATTAERFTPGTVTLTRGGTVTFDFEALPHNVFFDNAPAGAPDNITAASSNVSVTRTFNTAGRFVYNCHIHPGMTGVVVVQ
jgi:plastocyanin